MSLFVFVTYLFDCHSHKKTEIPVVGSDDEKEETPRRLQTQYPNSRRRSNSKRTRGMTVPPIWARNADPPWAIPARHQRPTALPRPIQPNTKPAPPLAQIRQTTRTATTTMPMLKLTGLRIRKAKQTDTTKNHHGPHGNTTNRSTSETDRRPDRHPTTRHAPPTKTTPSPTNNQTKKGTQLKQDQQHVAFQPTLCRTPEKTPQAPTRTVATQTTNLQDPNEYRSRPNASHGNNHQTNSTDGHPTDGHPTDEHPRRAPLPPTISRENLRLPQTFKPASSRRKTS